MAGTEGEAVSRAGGQAALAPRCAWGSLGCVYFAAPWWSARPPAPNAPWRTPIHAHGRLLPRWPMQSLCTLRNHCRQWPRNTRYQADATPYLGRTCTGWIAPTLCWRTHSITSSARASTVTGTSSPSIFATFELMIHFILGRRLYWQLSRVFAPEDAIDVAGRASELIDIIRPIGDQAASSNEVTSSVDRGEFVPGGHRDDQFDEPPSRGRASRSDRHSIHARTHRSIARSRSRCLR
jgi:hypothetical protein